MNNPHKQHKGIPYLLVIALAVLCIIGLYCKHKIEQQRAAEQRIELKQDSIEEARVDSLNQANFDEEHGN